MKKLIDRDSKIFYDPDYLKRHRITNVYHKANHYFDKENYPREAKIQRNLEEVKDVWNERIQNCKDAIKKKYSRCNRQFSEDEKARELEALKGFYLYLEVSLGSKLRS